MISFYLASALWIVWFAIYEFDLVFSGFILELFGDELFAFVGVDLSGGSAFSQSPLKRVDSLLFSFVQVCLGDNPIS